MRRPNLTAAIVGLAGVAALASVEAVKGEPVDLARALPLRRFDDLPAPRIDGKRRPNPERPRWRQP